MLYSNKKRGCIQLFQTSVDVPHLFLYVLVIVCQICMVIAVNILHNDIIVRINLAGVGIGDGWMSPFHNSQYANFLYWSRWDSVSCHVLSNNNSISGLVFWTPSRGTNAWLWRWRPRGSLTRASCK